MLLVVGMSAAAIADELALSSTCKLEAGPVHAVARVLDGETIALDDGSEVRLVGALAPRASDVGADNASWPPAEATREALAGLVQGHSVTLAFGGRRVDRYNRWLAHLLVERDGARHWVQADLLTQGMARAYSLPENAACIEDLVASERPAREAHRGLWANAAYALRAADDPQGLLGYVHTFQLVSGRIASVARSHGRVYLNFGTRRRRGFSAVIRRTRDAPPVIGTQGLEGRTVLVRGWLELERGPTIEIGNAGQIDVIDAAKATEGTASLPGALQSR